MKNQIQNLRPTSAQLKDELRRMDRRSQYMMTLKSTVCTLMTLAAIFMLVATLWLPVLQVYGNSMAPTLTSGDVLLCVKTRELRYGDIAAFYHNNKILVKRVIGCGGDQMELDPQGNVSRNGILLSEDYIDMPSLGNLDIPLPCQVPNGSFFMMGDHRSTSLDSRSSTLGFIPEERILGKVLFRIWPLNRFGSVSPKGGSE